MGRSQQRYQLLRTWLLALFIFLIPLQSSAQSDSTEVERSPKKAVLYSIFPGGGQIYNGKYLKAILVMGAEIYYAYNFLVSRENYNSGGSESDRQDRNKYAWWIGFAYIYGLLDALVDSHLSTFDERDPELDKEYESSEKVTELETEKE
ncbi:MAG: DUF5683 domain-containing protein [Candidatus Marinimicrobia bacterium]|jgi:hypothetical protein|nr:DUF5683 domain-containing protein [Candidatus Neomarinimicrobiota bacterium]MDP6568791.1 DUF5683 domain-containing protein [Candidatus Neomarinimicrobiota bacterium]